MSNSSSDFFNGKIEIRGNNKNKINLSYMFVIINSNCEYKRVNIDNIRQIIKIIKIKK